MTRAISGWPLRDPDDTLAIGDEIGLAGDCNHRAMRGVRIVRGLSDAASVSELGFIQPDRGRRLRRKLARKVGARRRAVDQHRSSTQGCLAARIRAMAVSEAALPIRIEGAEIDQHGVGARGEGRRLHPAKSSSTEWGRPRAAHWR